MPKQVDIPAGWEIVPDAAPVTGGTATPVAAAPATVGIPDGWEELTGVEASHPELSSDRVAEMRKYARKVGGKAFLGAGGLAAARDVPPEERAAFEQLFHEQLKQTRPAKDLGPVERMTMSTFKGMDALGENIADWVGIDTDLDDDQMLFRARLEAIKGGLDPLIDQDAPWYERGPLQAAQQAPTMVASLAVGGGLGKAAGAIGATGKGLWAAQATGVGATYYNQIHDDTYVELLKEGMDPETAERTAAVSAILQGVVEGGVVTNPFAKRMGSAAVSKTIRGIVASHMLRFGGEVGEEGLQAVVDETAKEFARRSTGGNKKNAADIAAAGLEAMQESLPALVFLMGPGMVAGGTAEALDLRDRAAKDERLVELEDVTQKGYVSQQDGEEYLIPGETRKERMGAAKDEIAAIGKDMQEREARELETPEAGPEDALPDQIPTKEQEDAAEIQDEVQEQEPQVEPEVRPEGQVEQQEKVSVKVDEGTGDSVTPTSVQGDKTAVDRDAIREQFREQMAKKRGKKKPAPLVESPAVSGQQTPGGIQEQKPEPAGGTEPAKRTGRKDQGVAVQPGDQLGLPGMEEEVVQANERRKLVAAFRKQPIHDQLVEMGDDTEAARKWADSHHDLYEKMDAAIIASAQQSGVGFDHGSVLESLKLPLHPENVDEGTYHGQIIDEIYERAGETAKQIQEFGPKDNRFKIGDRVYEDATGDSGELVRFQFDSDGEVEAVLDHEDGGRTVRFDELRHSEPVEKKAEQLRPQQDAETEEGAGKEEAVLDYSGMSSKELGQLLKGRQIPGRGKATKKTDRIALLEQHDRGTAAETTEKSKTRTEKSRERVKKAGNAIKKAAKEQGDTLSLNPADPKWVGLVVEYASAQVELGVNKFRDFVDAFRAEHGDELTRKLDAVLEEGWGTLPEFDIDVDEAGSVEDILSEAGKANEASPGTVRDTPGQGSEETTGVKHAKTDELREKIGMGARVSPETVTNEEMDEEAARVMRDDPEYAARLAEQEAHSPDMREGSLKHAVIQRYIRDLENRRAAGEDVRDALVTAITADTEMGSAAGATLQSRQPEMESDFTLVGSIRRHLKEFDEQPNAEWLAKYEALEARVQAAEEQAAAVGKKLAEEQAEKAILKAKQSKPQPTKKKGTRKAQRVKQRAEAVSALKKEWETLGQMSAIFDPEAQAEKWDKIVRAAANVVKVYASTGVDSALEFVALVKADMGKLSLDQEKALREAWAAENVESPLGDNPEPSEIGAFAKKLMRLAVDSGIEGRDNVVDAVQAELQAAGVDISRDETMLAMSDYGIYREIAKDDTSVKVRAIRGELQQLLKLKDIEAGQIPKRTGTEQRDPSKAETELEHDVHEAMKRSGFSTTGPTKLTTPLASKKKATDKRLAEVNDEIDQLTANIKKGTPLKADGTRTELVVDEALIELQSKLAAAHLERDELRKQSPEWQAREQSNSRDRYEKSLRRRLEFWQKRLKSAKQGKLPPKRKKSPFAKEFTVAKAEIDDIKTDALVEIEKEKRRRWNTGQKIGHGLMEATATIPRELMAGLEMSVVSRQGVFYTHGHPILAFFNLVDAIPSIVSRRIALAAEEKIRQRPNAASEYEAAGIEFTQESGPNKEEIFSSSVVRHMAATTHPLLLPPRLLAKAYGGFERGFRIFSNTMKADLYDIIKRDTLEGRAFFGKLGIGKQGWSESDMKTTGRSANIFSGRGTGLKSGNAVQDWLWFARRWVWSRVQADFILPFQMMTPKAIGQWNADPALRLAHAKVYAQALVGAAAHLAIAYWMLKLLADDEPTIEPSLISTDFGKPKVGDTRLDIGGGLPQYLTLAARIATGKTKNSRGEIKDLRGEDVDFAAPGVRDALMQVIQYKLGPGASGIMDFFAGETVIGEPLPEDPMRRAAAIVGNRMHPMAYPDMWEAEKSLGLKQGTVVAIEAFFGAGVSTYGPKTKYRDATEAEREDQFAKDLKRMQWDSPDPPYSEFLTEAQLEQVRVRREERKQSIVDAATAEPDRDSHKSDETFQESLDKRKKARETLKETGLSHVESQKLLLDRYKGKRTGNQYWDKFEALADLYGMDKDTARNELLGKKTRGRRSEVTEFEQWQAQQRDRWRAERKKK